MQNERGGATYLTSVCDFLVPMYLNIRCVPGSYQVLFSLTVYFIYQTVISVVIPAFGRDFYVTEMQP